MNQAAEAAEGPHQYFGDEERDDRELAAGTVCVRSLKSPEKEGPNEDAAALIPLGNGSLVAAVADGVGGTPAGREASRLALKHLCKALRAHGPDPEGLRATILDAVDHANRAILEIGRGAATTLVVAELDAKKLRGYHVGDSELIVVGQRGRIKLRIVPHSPTGFAVEAGLLGEDEAVQHDQRHILFNVIGSQDMRVEIGAALKLDARDTVLLATDGLLDNLYIDEIVEAIRKGPLPAAADKLVELARKRMCAETPGKDPSKPDDLTVMLYRPRPKRRAPKVSRP